MKGTIKSKEDVERLFSRGRRSTSSFMTILVRENTSSIQGRCAFIAGKKLGTAPLRNRCKRVMREVARNIGAPFEGYDIAFVAKKKVAFEKHEEIMRQARRSLAKLGVMDERVKLVSSCECHGVCSKLSLCHCEGAGVRWTPLQSRSTDRAGRRDTKRLWQSVSPLRVLRILSCFALRMTNRLVVATAVKCAAIRSHKKKSRFIFQLLIFVPALKFY